jgi:hypothetical protein
MVNAREEVFLLHKPHILRLQLFVRLRELEVKPPHYFWNKHGDLENRDVLANTGPRTCAELHDEC